MEAVLGADRYKNTLCGPCHMSFSTMKPERQEETTQRLPNYGKTFRRLPLSPSTPLVLSAWVSAKRRVSPNFGLDLDFKPWFS